MTSQALRLILVCAALGACSRPSLVPASKGGVCVTHPDSAKCLDGTVGPASSKAQ